MCGGTGGTACARAGMEPNRVYPIISPSRPFIHAGGRAGVAIRSPRLYHCQRHSSSPVELGGRRSGGSGAEYIMPPAVDDNVPPNGVPTFHILSLKNCGGILF